MLSGCLKKRTLKSIASFQSSAESIDHKNVFVNSFKKSLAKIDIECYTSPHQGGDKLVDYEILTMVSEHLKNENQIMYLGPDYGAHYPQFFTQPSKLLNTYKKLKKI